MKRLTRVGGDVQGRGGRRGFNRVLVRGLKSTDLTDYIYRLMNLDR